MRADIFRHEMTVPEVLPPTARSWSDVCRYANEGEPQPGPPPEPLPRTQAIPPPPAAAPVQGAALPPTHVTPQPASRAIPPPPPYTPPAQPEAQPPGHADELPHPEVMRAANWRKISKDSFNVVKTTKLAGDRRFFFKKYEIPGEAHVEHAATHIMRMLGFEDVPAARVSNGSHDPLAPGDDPHFLVKGVGGDSLAEVMEPRASPKAQRRAANLKARMLAKNPPEKLANLLTAHWLINASDRHEKNYIVGYNGELHPIDFGASFHELANSAGEVINWEWNQDALVMYGLVRPDQPLDKGFLRGLLEKRGQILEAADRLLPKTDGNWHHYAMHLLRKKFEAIPALLRRENPRLHHLPKDTTPRLSYDQQGHRRPNTWTYTPPA